MKLLRRLRPLSLMAGACGMALLCGCDGAAKTAPRALAPPVRQPISEVAPALHADLHSTRQEPAVAAPAVGAAITNVFAATSWQPAAAPSPPPSDVPPVEPVSAPLTAPPIPYRFIGRYGDADSQIVMLVKDDRLYLVAVGETIDNAYRIERVSGTTVELTYLPLKFKQSLSTGGAGQESSI